MNKLFLNLILFASILSFSNSVFAVTPQITLKPGDQITISDSKDTIIKCIGNSGNNGSGPRCHSSFGERSCQGLEVGSTCKGSFEKRGVCLSTGIFDGAPKCDCDTSEK